MIAPHTAAVLSTLLLGAVGQTASAASPAPPASAAPGLRSCEALKSLKLPGVEIVAATFMQAGAVDAAVPTVAGRSKIALAARCEVKALARPTRDSEIGIEVWLPADTWNGKYQQTGNGGWAGAVHRAPLAGALRRGYAAAATDGGHQGGIDDEGRGVRSAEFAIGHPEKFIDYGRRSLKETHTTATALIRAFYGRDARRSYFVGCSDGGREALMVAQRFADDFDGILAGNPGADWSHWSAGLVWAQQAQLAGTPGAIPITKRALIQNAVLAACDATDGVRDGLLSDPLSCRFDPAVLLCAGDDEPGCLTTAQVGTLRKIYEGPRNPRTGEQIYPGYPPGIENAPGSSLITPAQPGSFSYGATYFGQAVFERNDWDFQTLDFDKDIALSDRKGSPVVDAVNPDLRSFRARGGKLIQYHGWADGLMPAAASIAYYENVAKFMTGHPDPRSGGPRPVADFYRLFLIPGMGHCYGGAGPTAIVPVTDADALDSKYDLMLALETWVEKDVAPDLFIGSGRAPLAPSKTMTRPICAYPYKALYDGVGDAADAAAFTCAAPPVSDPTKPRPPS